MLISSLVIHLVSSSILRGVLQLERDGLTSPVEEAAAFKKGLRAHLSALLDTFFPKTSEVRYSYLGPWWLKEEALVYVCAL